MSSEAYQDLVNGTNLEKLTSSRLPKALEAEINWIPWTQVFLKGCRADLFARTEVFVPRRRGRQASGVHGGRGRRRARPRRDGAACGRATCTASHARSFGEAVLVRAAPWNMSPYTHPARGSGPPQHGQSPATRGIKLCKTHLTVGGGGSVNRSFFLLWESLPLLELSHHSSLSIVRPSRLDGCPDATLCHGGQGPHTSPPPMPACLQSERRPGGS